VESGDGRKALGADLSIISDQALQLPGRLRTQFAQRLLPIQLIRNLLIALVPIGSDVNHCLMVMDKSDPNAFTSRCAIESTAIGKEVAQVSKLAVSPTSQSAALREHARQRNLGAPAGWKPAIQQVWKPALQRALSTL
jgi:hypothetical protein